MRLVLCDSRPRTSSPVACRRAARFGATVLALPGGRLGRPGGRAATARSAAGRSSAQLASSGKRSAPLRPRSAPRWRLLVEFVASAVGLRCAPAISAYGLNRGLAGRPRPRCRSPGVRSRRPHPRIPVRGVVAEYVSSPRASFAACAANRVRPSLSARRSAVPPAPLAMFCSVRRGDASRSWLGGADSRARGRRGSPIASGVSLVETHLAEGNGLSRLID